MANGGRGGTAALAAGGVLWCVLAVVVLARPIPGTASVVTVYVVQALTIVGASAVMWQRARGSRPGLARGRRLLAIAMMCTFVAGVLAIGRAATGGDPDVISVDDVVHLSFMPVAAAALLSYPVSTETAGSRLRSLLDGLVAGAALWFVVWTTVMQPGGVGSDVSGLQAVMVLAYPAGDVFLVGLAVSVIARVHGGARLELSLLTLGLALYATADVAYAASEAEGTFRPDAPMALVAEAGIVLVLAGARVAGRPRPRTSARRPAWLRALPLLPLLPLVAALVVGSALLLRDEPMSRAGALTGVTISALLGLRQVVSGRDHRAVSRRLAARDELFRSLVLGSSDLITLHGPDGGLLYASPALVTATGVAERAGQQLGAFLHPDDRPGAGAAWQRAAQSPGETARTLLRLRCLDGTYRWHESRMRLLVDGDVSGVVVNTRDVHEQHLLAEQVRHDAEHDALTGLGNLARARRLVGELCESPELRSILLVDLDGFKDVNDTFGHAQGDALLVAVASQLRACVRGEDEVLRIGGDEFLVVLEAVVDAEAVAERVVDALHRPLPAGDRLLTTGGSVGLADTRSRPSPEELMRNADLAMYAAKDAGRNRWARYAPRLHENLRATMAVQAGLRRAFAEDRFTLHYQPVVSLVGGAAVAFEALLRWTDPELGSVGPDVFIPVAERCGLMPQIDTWVLDRACADLAAWGSAGLAVLPVSVNVSRTELTAALPDRVAAALHRHRVPARLLRVEVTESAVVLDPDAALAALTALRRLGVLVLLDDFGTGQSSLSQLARLPVDTVKVDKSFVLASSADPGAARLLDSILGVCHALELPVVAEGIETAQVAGHLAAIGCQYGQGWHYGRPAPAAETARRLAPWIPLLGPAGDGPARDHAQTTIRIGRP